MKTVTINKNRILFGAMVVTLGLSQSWLSPREYATFGDQSLALEAAKNHCIMGTDCGDPRLTSPTPVSPTATPAPSTVVPAPSKPVESRTADFKSTSKDGKVVNNIKAVIRNNIKAGEIKTKIENGMLVEDTSATPTAVIEATFVVNGTCTDCVQTLTLVNVKSFEEMTLKIQEHINTSLTEKEKKEQDEKLAAAKREQEAKALKLAIEKCDKAEVDGEIVDLKKSKNRKLRIECLAAKVDASDDDKNAFRKLRSAISKEIMAHAKSEDPTQRQEAIDMLDDLGTEYSDNRNLEKYLTTMKKGAEDFNQITEISQAAANDPAVRAQSVYQIDYLAGKWNPARTAGMSEGVRLGVTDWHNPMLAIARQAQKDPKVIARQYFGTGDLELDSEIGLGDSVSTGLAARGTRTSIGLDTKPTYFANNRSINNRRGSALGGRNNYRGFANEYDDMYMDDDYSMRYNSRDNRYNDRYNNSRYNSRNGRYGNNRYNDRYNDRFNDPRNNSRNGRYGNNRYNDRYDYDRYGRM
jgi:hypothetical protein